MKQLLENLRKIPDFPKPGILFYDVTSWLSNPECIAELERQTLCAIPSDIDKIIAIDARGFIVGTIIARALHKPLYLARKPGKLPVQVDTMEYLLEYGTDKLCLEKGVISQGDKVLICDDLLATGGTIKAVADIIKQYNPATVTSFVWLELEGLEGRNLLNSNGVKVLSLMSIPELKI